MRILYSSQRMRKDGSTIHSVEIARALENLGIEMVILPPLILEKKGGAGQPDNRSALKRIVPRLVKEVVAPLLCPTYVIAGISRVQEAINVSLPDVFVFRTDYQSMSLFWLSNLVARWTAKRNRLPLILEVNAPLVYEHQKFFGGSNPSCWHYPFLASISERGIWRAADAIICVSRELKDFLVRLGVSPAKVFVIPNGVDLEKFSLAADGSAVRKKYNMEDNTVVGFVGSLKSWHGADNMVESLKVAISRNRNIRGLIVGEDAGIGRLIERSDLSGRVVLTGNVPHSSVPEYISAMDIAVAPYPNIENFYFSPLKIFEYMAMAKPVVASGIGQIRDIIIHRQNGYLVEPGDIGELAACMVELSDNAELRRAIGANARRTVEESYTWMKSAKAVANICRAAVANREKKVLLEGRIK